MVLQGNTFHRSCKEQFRLSKQRCFCFQSKLANENKVIHSRILQRTHVNSSAARKYSNTLMKLQEEFCHRFQDFKKVEDDIQLLICPFSFDVE